MVEHVILSSGSKGNAVILGGTVLVDCGVSFRAIEPYLDGLRLVLLTHTHGDHFKKSTVARLGLERPGLRFGCGGWMVHSLIVDCSVRADRITALKAHAQYRYPGCDVEPVPLRHDVPNFGYKLLFPEGSVFYATDTCSLDYIEAPGFDLYMVEANYQDKEIRERMAEKKANGQYAYERRAMENHLSREKCDNFLARNMGSQSMYIYMHQHEEPGGTEI